ncbi:hypothetical protein [Polaromonas sp. CG_9.11]|uniref:hypothetical protein n=1 Tax=Polaromonas sp. CG_9.11 TaxID=2787730 RepID=UPI0018CB7096|nr:hypothetical protein [Polaromonas sp. CG_9.11]MBG6077201.1 hypothetical protein [Polaromonas sp. CG_9.11]
MVKLLGKRQECLWPIYTSGSVSRAQAWMTSAGLPTTVTDPKNVKDSPLRTSSLGRRPLEKELTHCLVAGKPAFLL